MAFPMPETALDQSRYRSNINEDMPMIRSSRDCWSVNNSANEAHRGSTA
jgi:hypothetical protein